MFLQSQTCRVLILHVSNTMPIPGYFFTSLASSKVRRETTILRLQSGRRTCVVIKVHLGRHAAEPRLSKETKWRGGEGKKEGLKPREGKQRALPRCGSDKYWGEDTVIPEDKVQSIGGAVCQGGYRGLSGEDFVFLLVRTHDAVFLVLSRAVATVDYKAKAKNTLKAPAVASFIPDTLSRRRRATLARFHCYFLD